MRLALGVFVLALNACTVPDRRDAGLDSGSTDASDAGDQDGGDVDAGGDDSGIVVDPEVPHVILSATSDDRVIHLTWLAKFTAQSWQVLRNGQVIATLPSASRSFDDTTAPPGDLGSFDASVSIGVPSGVEIDWVLQPGTGRQGTPQRYEVVAQLITRMEISNAIYANCTAPHVVRWIVTRGDAGWSIGPDEEFMLDSTAPAPSVSVTDLVSRAVPDDYSTSVAVIADASVSYVPRIVEYVVGVEPSAGASPASITLSGSRGGDRVAFQWQRSTADSPDASFIDLQYVHGRQWADFDAMMNEGRFYRVVATSGSQQWVSTPTRAFLVRPYDLIWPWVVRDDGFAFSLESPSTTMQFDRSQVQQFAGGILGRLCVLLVDGGTDCFDGTPAPPVRLPFAASRLVFSRFNGFGQAVCSETVRDASVDCYPNSNVNASELVDVTEVSSHVCGHLPDAGIRCAPWGGGTVVDLNDAPAGSLGRILFLGVPYVSWPNGLVHLPPAGPPLFPVEDAGYSGGFFRVSNPYWVCGRRLDGFLRCEGIDRNAPVSREPVEVRVELDVGSVAELTTGHRLRLTGFHRAPLPLPPIRQISENTARRPVFLAEDGRFEGFSSFTPRIDYADRFTQISVNESFFALNSDGVMRIAEQNERLKPVPPEVRFSKLGGGLAVITDGGLYSFRDLLWDAGSDPFIDVSYAGNYRSCARRPDRSWVCNGVPFAGHYEKFSANCALTAREKLECNHPLPPEFSQLRFSSMDSLGGSYVTVDGRELTFDAQGVVSEYGPWDDIVEAQSYCFLRRDRTAGCYGGFGLGGALPTFPWTDK